MARRSERERQVVRQQSGGASRAAGRRVRPSRGTELELQDRLGNRRALALRKQLAGLRGAPAAEARIGRAADPEEAEANRAARTVTQTHRGEPPQAAGPDAGGAAPPQNDDSGSPLPPTLRTSLESSFSRELSGVRLHTGPDAARTANALNARAFTAGSDITFGDGEYRPETPAGLELLAHEIAHVVQEGERQPAVIRRQQVDPEPGGGGIDLTLSWSTEDLHAALVAAYSQAFNSREEPEQFKTQFLAQIKPALSAIAEGNESLLATLEGQAEYVRDIQLQSTPQALDARQLLLLLDQLDERAAVNDALTTYALTLGTEQVLHVLADEAAAYILWILDPDMDTGWEEYENRITTTLNDILAATRNGEARLTLELEGTLAALVRERAAWNRAAPDKRAPIGENIGTLARRVLLLDRAIGRIRAGVGGPQQGALDSAMEPAMMEIGRIRTTAIRESNTLSELGDSPALLGEQYLSGVVGTFFIPPPDLEVIEPDVAFPAATDAATTDMLNAAVGLVEEQSAEVARLRARVIPEERSYTLTEFVQLFRRWWGFFSPEQEQREPAFRFIAGFFDARFLLSPKLDEEERRSKLAKLRSPYDLTGIGISLFDKASGSVARAMMTTWVPPILANTLGSPQDAFAEQILAARFRREQMKVRGTASSPDPYVTSGFDVGQDFLSPENAAEAWTDRSARAFDPVAREREIPPEEIARARVVAKVMGDLAPEPKPPQKTRFDNIRDLGRLLPGGELAAWQSANPGAPFVGLHRTSTEEGWSYLIEVLDPEDPDTPVVAREHRAVPPEVSAYLLAAHQQQETLREPFRPVAAGKRVGDRSTRHSSAGLEDAQATALATQRGDTRAPSPRDVASDRLRLKEARQKILQKREGPGGLVLALAWQLERCLDEYFEKHAAPEYSLAAILAIACIEHGAGAQFEEVFSPERLLETVQDTVKMNLALSALRSFGPVGGLVATGIDAHMRTKGCNEWASVAGISAFLMGAAKARSLREARAWAYLVSPIIGDIQNLVDSMASHAAGKALEGVMHHLASDPPGNQRELERTMRDLDPEARSSILHAIEAEQAQMRRDGKESSPEYQQIEHLRKTLIGDESAPPPEIARLLDAPVKPELKLPGALEGRLRTQTERDALSAMVPPELRGKVVAFEDPLANPGEMKVVEGQNRIEIRVGRVDPDGGPVENSPGAMNAHLELARDLSRYVGVSGTLNRVARRIQARFDQNKDRHTFGYEANLEVEKLGRMRDELTERQAALQRRARDLEKSTGQVDDVEVAALDQDIASVERQLILYSQFLASPEAARGYVAVKSAPESIRDTLKLHGLEGTVADSIVRDARSRGQLGALGDLADSGALTRLMKAGAEPRKILDTLETEGGFRRLIAADSTPDEAAALFGDDVGKALAAQRRARGTAALRRTPSEALAAKWGINPATKDFEPDRLPNDWTVKEIEDIADNPKWEEGDYPRDSIVYRRWRYVQRVGRENAPRSKFGEWAKSGYQANANRELSSPFEAAAIEAMGAKPNNTGLIEGGQKTYEYWEWVDDRGVFMASGEERKPRGSHMQEAYETRPDGIRPRGGGGFDIVEHKHLTGDVTVLNDSIQLRAEHEMAKLEGKGKLEIVISSDRSIVDGQPPVRPSGPLGTRNAVFYFDRSTGRVTHKWNAKKELWVEKK